MIALDTNLLVRYLTRDDADQAALVDDLLARCIEDGTPCAVTVVALCELGWVLKRAYAVPRGEIAAALQGLLSEELFQIEGREAVQRALDQFERGKGDFSDYLLGETGRALGAETTFTFDRRLRDSEPFTLLR